MRVADENRPMAAALLSPWTEMRWSFSALNIYSASLPQPAAKGSTCSFTRRGERVDFVIPTRVAYHFPCVSPCTLRLHQHDTTSLCNFEMVKKGASQVASTPATLKKSNSSSNQRTLHGFFSKTPTPGATKSTGVSTTDSSFNKSIFSDVSSISDLTPVPSSDALEPAPEDDTPKASTSESALGLLLPASADETQADAPAELTSFGTPSRKVQKAY